MVDLHGGTAMLRNLYYELEYADLVLLGGDLTNFGKRQEAEEILNTIERVSDAQVLAVSGNCDYLEVEQVLDERGINLHGKYRRFEHACVAGLGRSLPCPGHTPNEMTEDEYGDLLGHMAAILPAETPFILLSHQPPKGTSCDRIPNGQHVGSEYLRAFIKAYQPLCCLTGHIHEGEGIDYIGDTAIINPGPLRHGGYVTFELNDGVVEDLQLQHVGRRTVLVAG